ncbi:MAG TPA: NifB/NifX family molybdenum-iron cluster-binding protein [Polyangiaceae bacterium]|nr:NifB/NifX family molybdenum-iron cluster-binding protein [Polyangiaceae bacterium]
MADESKPQKNRRVAVATSDGIVIDQHLGQASSVWVYDVARDGTSQFIENRSISAGDQLDPHRWECASKLFSGVDAVLAAKAGPGATAMLREHGILALAVTGPVERALAAFGRRGWILGREPVRQGLPAAGECCRGGCKTPHQS